MDPGVRGGNDHMIGQDGHGVPDAGLDIDTARIAPRMTVLVNCPASSTANLGRQDLIGPRRIEGVRVT